MNEKEITITGWQSPKELAVIATALKLAEFFNKNGHSAEDLRAAIRTTMHINLEN